MTNQRPQRHPNEPFVFRVDPGVFFKRLDRVLRTGVAIGSEFSLPSCCRDFTASTISALFSANICRSRFVCRAQLAR